MKYAFAIFKYFPFGGLQRDMLRMAEEAASRGHRVTVFTSRWDGPQPENLEVRIIPWRGLSNHSAAVKFAARLKQELAAEDFDRVVLFNRMDVPADFYFAADDCQADVLARRHCSLMLKLHPRYRTFLKQEKALFTAEDGPAVWYIAPQQKTAFRKCYGTPEERFRYLPPGMNPACRRPEESKVREIREAKRRELGLAPDEIAVILVAAQFHLKGGDRLLQGIAALPEELRRRIRLIWAGNGSDSLCRRMARRLNLAEQVKVLGGRNDVPELLLASDIMIHPARFESAGSVLIEAIAAGVPVIATAACGFASFVAEIHGKLVLKEPFCQEELNDAMVQALKMLPELTEKTIDYASRADFCSRAARAVDMLEEERKS